MLRSLAAFGLSVAVTLAAYLALLGWDQEKKLGPDGYEHGPYSAWQVAGMALTLGAIAWLAGRHHHALAGVTAASLTFTIAWSIDAATDNDEEPSFWPLSAMFIAFGCALVLPLIASLGSTTGRPVRPPER